AEGPTSRGGTGPAGPASSRVPSPRAVGRGRRGGDGTVTPGAAGRHLRRASQEMRARRRRCDGRGNRRVVGGHQMALTTTGAPTREDLVRRAADLAPVLRRHSAWTEEHRRIHDESIEALADAGIFKLRTPARYGGYEADTRTLVDVATELGRADGSTSWVASVYWIPTWMTCLFPDHVQDEVFATPDARICGTLSPSGMAAPTDGGIVLNSRWGFISGGVHAHWEEIIAVLVGPDHEPYPVMALVPMTDLQVVDDWYTSGLKGTGSVSTIAQDLFVPAERVLP